MKQYHLPSLLLASATLAWAVPAQINYQGRLTDANGDPVTGEVSMSLKMFDAATAGNELYSEDIGTVTLDDNGVYSFPFGASGQSVVDREETIAITDGSSTSFSNTLGSVPLDETLVVADGTYSWNVVDGNPGEQATATAVLANGFVVGVTVTNGGEGYVEPPAVTIEGLGSGATATAVVENGAITAINVDATGSGYASATVTIAEPPAPYVVNYDAGTVSVTYEAAPYTGNQIVATYEANDSSIVGALAAAESHWLELSVDGVAQSPRERVLSVPFAQVAGVAQALQSANDMLKGFTRSNPGESVEVKANEVLEINRIFSSKYEGATVQQIEVHGVGYSTITVGRNKVYGPATVSAYSSSSSDGLLSLSYRILNLDGSVQVKPIERPSYDFTLVEGSYTWEQARLDAESRGGRLAVLDTESKMEQLIAFLQTSGTWPIFFIGATDVESEGNWKWLNGKSVTIPNWRSGEPNGGSRENYAEIYSSGHDQIGMWNDINGSTSPRSYLLEFTN